MSLQRQSLIRQARRHPGVVVEPSTADTAAAAAANAVGNVTLTVQGNPNLVSTASGFLPPFAGFRVLIPDQPTVFQPCVVCPRNASLCPTIYHDCPARKPGQLLPPLETIHIHLNLSSDAGVEIDFVFTPHSNITLNLYIVSNVTTYPLLGPIELDELPQPVRYNLVPSRILADTGSGYQLWHRLVDLANTSSVVANQSYWITFDSPSTEWPKVAPLTTTSTRNGTHRTPHAPTTSSPPIFSTAAIAIIVILVFALVALLITVILIFRRKNINSSQVDNVANHPTGKRRSWWPSARSPKRATMASLNSDTNQLTVVSIGSNDPSSSSKFLVQPRLARGGFLPPITTTGARISMGDYCNSSDTNSLNRRSSTHSIYDANTSHPHHSQRRGSHNNHNHSRSATASPSRQNSRSAARSASSIHSNDRNFNHQQSTSTWISASYQPSMSPSTATNNNNRAPSIHSRISFSGAAHGGVGSSAYYPNAITDSLGRPESVASKYSTKEIFKDVQDDADSSSDRSVKIHVPGPDEVLDVVTGEVAPKKRQRATSSTRILRRTSLSSGLSVSTAGGNGPSSGGPSAGPVSAGAGGGSGFLASGASLSRPLSSGSSATSPQTGSNNNNLPVGLFEDMSPTSPVPTEKSKTRESCAESLKSEGSGDSWRREGEDDEERRELGIID